MKKLLINLINIYQAFLSFDKGLLSYFAPGGACKYAPSCSQYTKERIKEYGVFKGIVFGLKRIWSCR
ncbi:membrane protein insertion efficiency factor YidD [Candidatus Daviesbacteria bacterium]|nr:membrane protein insertion efficiency factor YidD [Candidatus Daviesbacteria bacterium]